MLRRQHKCSRDLLLLVPCPVALEMTVGLSGFHGDNDEGLRGECAVSLQLSCLWKGCFGMGHSFELTSKVIQLLR